MLEVDSVQEVATNKGCGLFLVCIGPSKFVVSVTKWTLCGDGPMDQTTLVHEVPQPGDLLTNHIKSTKSINSMP